MKTYPVAETFLSVQGEGVHAGRRAYFVRLSGCPVKCPWCDSKYSWNGGAERTVSELVGRVENSGAETAVITGGEPCVHDLAPLAAGLNSLGIAAHLETSGVLPVRETSSAVFSWVSVSPKPFAAADRGALKRADELKFTISDLSDLDFCEKTAPAAENAKALWLHPEWSKAGDGRLLSALAGYVESRGGLWRLGWQIHKNYKIR